MTLFLLSLSSFFTSLSISFRFVNKRKHFLSIIKALKTKLLLSSLFHLCYIFTHCYKAIYKVWHSINQNIWFLSPMSHFSYFSPWTCRISKRGKFGAENEPTLDANFVFYFLKCAYFLHKMYYLDEQLHQNVNEMVRTRHTNKWKSLDRVTSLFVLDPLPYVILCHLFGKPLGE